MKADEAMMLRDMLKFGSCHDCTEERGYFSLRGPDDSLTPREMLATRWRSAEIHHKRAGYILGKWADRNWYDYGVNLELGWLTPEGVKAAREQMGEGR